MSLDFRKLIWSEKKFIRSTINVFEVHVPRSLGACGSFFDPFVATVDNIRTDLTG